MVKQEREKIKLILYEYGDDFWREGNDNILGDNVDTTNTVLFDDIVEVLNSQGYDLKLIKL